MMTAATPLGAQRSVGVLFAEDFDLPLPASPREDLADEPHVISAQPTLDSDAIRAEAFAQGHAEGHREAMAGRDAAAEHQAAATQQYLQQIAACMTEAARAGIDLAEQAAHSVAQLVLGTLSAMFPALCARHGSVEISALIAAVLPALAHEPRVQIRISPASVTMLQTALNRLDADLSKRIAIAPQEAMHDGDVRVLWQDGSASRDTGEIWQGIRAALAPLGLPDLPNDLVFVTGIAGSDAEPTAPTALTPHADTP